jgi:hypothetical protein
MWNRPLPLADIKKPATEKHIILVAGFSPNPTLLPQLLFAAGRFATGHDLTSVAVSSRCDLVLCHLRNFYAQQYSGGKTTTCE